VTIVACEYCNCYAGCQLIERHSQPDKFKHKQIPPLLSVLILVVTFSYGRQAIQMISYIQAGNDDGNSNIGDSNLNKLGSKIAGLELPPGCVFNGSVKTCAALVTCVGTKFCSKW